MTDIHLEITPPPNLLSLCIMIVDIFIMTSNYYIIIVVLRVVMFRQKPELEVLIVYFLRCPWHVGRTTAISPTFYGIVHGIEFVHFYFHFS